MELFYFQLRAYFIKREEALQASFKLSELADLWLCTAKQCKRRLKEYQMKGKLTYIPGKGRGNYSQAIFSKAFQYEVQEIVDSAILNNRLDEVMELLQLDIPKEWFDKVFKEIQGMFGVQHNQDNQDILRFILRRPITSINPLKTAVSREAFLLRQLGDSLLIFDEEEHRLKPGLAHHWTSSEDYREWTFHLRKSVRFHHGRVMTSEDVRYTLLQGKLEDSVVFWQLRTIEKIDCPSPYTVKVSLTQSEPFFAHYVSVGNLVILPFDIPFSEKRWVSTGPFKLKERTEKSIILEVFEEYYGERPLMDQVEFWVVEHPDLPVVISPYKEPGEDNFVEQGKKAVGVDFLIFNFQRQSFVHQTAFREVFYHLLDIAEMEKSLTVGLPASRFYPEQSQLVKRTPEKIKELLNEAGYRGEQLLLGALQFSEAKENARWLQQQAEMYGIRLEIVDISLDESFYKKDFEEKVDLMMMGDVPASYQELAFLDFCCNPNLLCQRFYTQSMLLELEAKIAEMKYCENYEERELKYEEVEKWLTANYFLVYICHPEKMEMVHSAVHWEKRGISTYLDLRTVWTENEEA